MLHLLWYNAPMSKEYQCFDLDPALKLGHGDNPVLLETDDLAEACGFIYKRHKETGKETAVWQPRQRVYRDHYLITNRHSTRGADGRFITKEQA